VIVVVISVMLAETIAWAMCELRCREKRLAVLAATDPLTELFNRSAFRSRLTECCRRREHLMLAFVDLNGFKDINDTYGHQAGDAVLTEVARRLRTITREKDVLGRFGGDEFVVLFRSPDLDEHALVERIRQVLALPWPMIAPAAVTASVGVVEDRAGARAPDDLLREADTAMYARKHGTTAESAPEMMASRSLSYYRAAMDGLGGTFAVLRAIHGDQQTDWQVIEANGPVRAYYESNCGEQIGLRLSAADRYSDYSPMREIYTRALETGRPQRTRITLNRPETFCESRRLIVVPIDGDVVVAMTFGISTDATTDSNVVNRDQYNATTSVSALSTATNGR
jgi:diguanylate cyclase (GGDEF)-like protein